MADLRKLEELESIRQGAGETVFSYLCRIRVAAARTEVMKFGTCSKKSHPDLTLEECEKGPNDEPATELSWPCAKGKKWDTLTRDSTLGVRGILTDKHEACPPCCKKVRDYERQEWLVKKQFLTKMYNKKMQKELMLALVRSWMIDNLKPPFNVLDINMEDIINTAQVLEEYP